MKPHAPNPSPSPSPDRSITPALKARWALAGSALTVLRAGLAGLLLVPLALVGAVWALLRSEGGTAWLLERVPGLVVKDPRGALLGPDFSARRIALTWAGGQAGVEIDAFAWQGAQWRWWVAPGVWVGVQVSTLGADRVLWRSGPTQSAPTLPSSLRLPVQVHARQLWVRELQVDAHPAVRDLRAEVQLESPTPGAGAGGRADAAASWHRIEELSLQWDRMVVQGGLQLGTTGDFALAGHLRAASTGGPPWEAQATLQGPLRAFSLQARLRGQAAPGGTPGQSSPSLDLKAQVRPLERWPLGTLEASTRGLDLSQLWSRAPQTRLDGRALLGARQAGDPLELNLEFDNALPGRLDQRRVPVRRLQAGLRAPSTQVEQLDASRFEMVFAGEAGRWNGSASWQGSTLRLRTQLSDLRPHLLDERAPAMRVSGPLELVISGLALHAADRAGPAPRSLAVQGELQGALDARPQPVWLSFEGRVQHQLLEFTRLQARSGRASAELQARLQQMPDRRWQARSEGRLLDFDPVVWVPGPEGSAWRRGPHRLNASWNLGVSLPEQATAAAPLQLLQSLQGQGQLELRDSVFSGVPLELTLKLAQEGATAAALRSRFQGNVLLAGNRFAFEGAGDPLGAGQDDRLQLEVDAPSLQALAPLAALDPLLARWTPRQGRAQLSLSAAGRWPALRTEGRAQLQNLRAAELELGDAALQWRMASGPDEPVTLQAQLRDGRIGVLRAARVRAQVSGTVRAHRLELDVAAPLQPPPLLAQALGLQRAAGTQAQLQGGGSWEGVAEGGGRWRGTLERLTAGVWNGSGAPAPPNPDASWLDTRDLRGEFRLGTDWSLQAARAAPGRATLAGGVPLRWDEVRWRADAGHPDFEVRAEIAPVAVAPFLRRARAGLGWAGDLRVGARLAMRIGEQVQAEVTLRRQDGDLQPVDDGSGAQPLGLGEAELSLSVREGVWRFTPKLSGSNLGQLAGSVTVRTKPEDRWPGAQAPLQGTVTLQVPNLAVWGAWVPPGWRIGGELNTVARLGGTFGSPQLTGELRASQVAVRNLLQGVSFSDGELRVALDGETARIERLSLRGGEGTLQADGVARLGLNPSAELRARAQQFRLIGRVDRQLVASGEGSLQISPTQLRASGRVAVDGGLFDLSQRDAPTLDEDVSIRGERDAGDETAPAAPAQPALLRRAQVELDLDLGERLRLRGFGLDTGLRGKMRLSTPGGRLAIHGTIRAEDGTYTGYGQKLEIERGVMTLAGPLTTSRLDILALRPRLDVRVGLAITGPTTNPRVKLVSEPEMGETEKLSWLLLGRGPEGLGRADSALLQRAATAVLAGQGESPGDALLRAIGLDDLSVRQTEGDSRDTIVSLGKQLGRRWYVGYERGVNATAGTFQLIYRIAQRFTLRAQSGLENSLDLIWTWRFDDGLSRPR